MADSHKIFSRKEVSSSPDPGSRVVVSAVHQDILLNEVRSETFIPTGKFEKLVLSLFVKIVAQFVEREPSNELAKAVEKQLLIINEISYKDEKYSNVVVKDCPVDFWDSLISVAGNPRISVEFINELSTLLLRVATILLVGERTYPWSLTFHHQLIEGISKLGSRTGPNCIRLLKKLCDSHTVKENMRQKDMFEKILDFVTRILSDDALSEELLMESVDFLIYITEEQTNLLRRCAARKTDELLLRRNLDSGVVQEFLHSVSISTSRITLPSPRPNVPQKTYTLSISDLHSSPSSGPRQRLEQKRSFSLVRDSCIPIVTSIRHIFLDVKSIELLTGPTISRAVCSLLNSGNAGVIYSGVRSDGLVHGLQTTRVQRDSFRCEMDRLLRTELDPPLCSSLVTVQFTPVIVSRASREDATEYSVLTIRLPSDLGQIYTWKKENKVYTCRTSNRMEELNLKGVRHLAAELGRREFSSVVQQLEQQLRSLSCQLQAKD